MRFPFGHGLSYVSFEYKNLTVSINRLTQKRIIDVKVTVNTIPEDEEEEEDEK